ncbi:hypothetical protein EA462_07525 [Natrarchaeobius halalkaliphilus]|uniref:Uncharacterized protein n=1 Tax=Natrarchaeobius halalkaliphilus TaxID=1679091 RepID=A0A3N6M8R1_9EURY|nr:hypothetical protein [Natrarchaeobius halalkaliphilus]RQG89856.1 hypothetical protein EA462_07525 [Natrarchaeobius halalkaliphilus]
MSDGSFVDEGFDELLEDATRSLETIEERLGGLESLDELDDDERQSILGDVETLTTVAIEAEELLETVDFGELPEAVDGDDLVEAIELGELPEVLGDEDSGPGDVVDFERAFRAIDLLSAWDATDLADLWEEKRELEGAVDDVAADDEDANVLEETVSAVTDESDDLLEGNDDLLGDAEPTDILGDIDVMEDPQAYQIAIQQAAIEGIDAFREGLLEAHETFERLYERNRETMRRQDASANSRNPTAASTVPVERRDLGGGARHATVPQQVRLSTAPSRTRIYGRRFELEREKRRNDDGR